ncbi:hypothetical protein HXX76_006068 [Chlamydomonas incerta]|uniref:Protein kinase domain-containing protein n=1 Tax=Chlamydomonas incerta TaxID=51695 RepID=A0A835T4U8_CHLIN|nr:hypothetical protein HXX76_006068 [Chlamydomonas incerta]|eukprot:KAG2437416.1 hypothetical protein HXX76_006068 [Chlamydomonas incerta]
MSFFARCISGSSLKGMVDQDEDLNTTSSTTTPNDTAHGGSKFGSLSWKRLSTRSSRSSLNSPKKPGRVSTPPPSLASSGVDGGATVPRPSMEPVMERTGSALTDLEAVKFLIEDWSHKHWRPATPQDQQCFDRIDQRDIKPLVALGEGAYGSVNLCRIPVSRLPCGATAAAARTASATGHAVPRHAMSQRELATSSVPLGPSAPSNAPSNRSSASGSGQQQHQAVAAAGGPGAAPPQRPHHQRAASSGAVFGQRSRTTSLNGGTMEEVPEVAEEPGAAGEAEAAEAWGGGGAAAPGAQPPVAEGSAGSTVAEEAAGSSPATLSSSSAASGSSSGPGARTAELDPGARSASGGAGSAAGAEASASEEACGAQLASASSVNDPQLIVAVKRVPLGWNQERELMQLHRCQQCPFIVRLFGFVEDGDEHCSYVMEWAEGGDLAGMLMSLKDRRGANKQRLLMSEASARYYMGCLLLALEFLHNNGLLHRDIKPSNLLLTSDGTAKLADLGFTVALDANGRTVGCCGTTGYIAPEVYAYGSSKTRSNYGIPADVWSAAATLYQVLTGSVVTDRPEEVLKKGWRPPTHPRFSPQLQDLLNRMLAAKPSSRPQSVASVMRHAWFAGFDWAALREGRMTAPYVPRERRHTRPEPPAGTAAPAGPSGPGAAAGAPAATGAAAAGAAGNGGAAGFARHSGGAGMSASSSGGPPPASPGGQRLATVLERTGGADGSNRGGGGDVAAGPGGEEIEVHRSSVQRSALSLRDEASVHRGREGLVRDGSSFDTALDTVPTAEAEAAAAHSMAVAALAGAGATDNVGNGGLQHGHGRVHGHVRFAMGVAECA